MKSRIPYSWPDHEFETAAPKIPDESYMLQKPYSNCNMECSICGEVEVHRLGMSRICLSNYKSCPKKRGITYRP